MSLASTERFGTRVQAYASARPDSDAYAPPPGDPAHAPMMAAAQRLFDAHAQDGAVRLVYRTRVFHARPIG